MTDSDLGALLAALAWALCRMLFCRAAWAGEGLAFCFGLGCWKRVWGVELRLGVAHRVCQHLTQLVLRVRLGADKGPRLCHAPNYGVQILI
jgi:hypothetical protein